MMTRYQLFGFSKSPTVHLAILTTHQATLEADAQRGNERAEGAEKKITDIEEELRVRERDKDITTEDFP